MTLQPPPPQYIAAAMLFIVLVGVVLILSMALWSRHQRDREDILTEMPSPSEISMDAVYPVAGVELEVGIGAGFGIATMHPALVQEWNELQAAPLCTKCGQRVVVSSLHGAMVYTGFPIYDSLRGGDTPEYDSCSRGINCPHLTPQQRAHYEGVLMPFDDQSRDIVRTLQTEPEPGAPCSETSVFCRECGTDLCAGGCSYCAKLTAHLNSQPQQFFQGVPVNHVEAQSPAPHSP